MTGPELLKEVMIRELKTKANQEEKLADELLNKMNATSGVTAQKYSEDQKKHRYAANEFRKMAKSMEDK